MGRDASPDRHLWAVHPRAAAEWLALTALLEAVGTVSCQTSDVEAWWPDGKQAKAPPARMAIAACRDCPAAAACLSYALAADERFGIWGGTLPHQRRAMRWETS